MKKEILSILCLAGLILGGAAVTTAGQMTYTLLTDASVGRHGPGLDLVIGTADDTFSGEKNNCNFSDVASCETLGNPTTGSFSFVKMDLVMTKSCMTGSNAGASCISDLNCPGCISPLCCVECDDVSYSYLGDVGIAAGNGTYTTCQEDGSTFDYTALNIGTSESVEGTGGGCLALGTPGDDSGNCGVGPFYSTMDVVIKISPLGGKCGLEGGTVPDVSMNGRSYDLSLATPAGVCNYTIAQINAIRAILPGTADFLVIACARNQTLPGDLTTACLSGAQFDSTMVAYTSQDASDCSSPCGGGCLMGTAEGVE